MALIPTIEIYIYTNSKSNIKCINQNQYRRRQEFPNKTLSPSWDLHQAIHRELTNLPNFAICHIKAHQDQSTLNAELTRDAKLNIEADKLAEEVYSSSTFSDQVPMIPGVSSHLLIDGKTIVSKHRVIFQDVRRMKAIKLGIQEKTGMMDQALDEVDWESHTMAVGRSQLSQPFLVKLLHQILPIGTLIHKYDPVTYTIGCPTCRDHYDHLFQCHHPSRVGWKTQLKATLIKFTDETNSHHLLQDILVTGIHSWIHGLPFPAHRYPPNWQELINSQPQIGWKQLLLGRFSLKWLEYQEQHLQINKKPFTNSNHGPLWLSTLIIRIRNHCYELWESRNKDNHGHDAETERAALLAQVKRRMAVMYQLKHRCFPSDRVKWFHTMLEEHITKEPHLYQQPARLDEPMIRSRIHDRDRVTQQRLHTIDEYFPPLPAGTANR
jgi:hypothetical protein